MEMVWTFGELESTLARLHYVADSARTKFQARLKNFHKLDFPEGFGRGRGNANLYEPKDVFLMNMALHLTRLGVTPKRVTGLLKGGMACIVTSVLIATWDWMPELYRAAADEEDILPLVSWTERFSVYGVFDPLGMADLLDPGLVGSPTEGWFQHRGPADFGDVLSGWLSTNANISVVNISEVLHRSALIGLVGLGRSDDGMRAFMRSVREWALSYEMPEDFDAEKGAELYPIGPERTRQWLFWYNVHAFGWQYLTGPSTEEYNEASEIFLRLSPQMKSYLRREVIDPGEAGALHTEALALGIVSENSLRPPLDPVRQMMNDRMGDRPAAFPDVTLVGVAVQMFCFGCMEPRVSSPQDGGH